MLPLLIVLGIGTFAWLWWRWRFTTLTRDCRWRQDRPAGEWYCAFCGARVTTEKNAAPDFCAQRKE